MKISVILNSYNRPRQVKEAVISIQRQTYKNWELFIVDDNSNIETKQVLNAIRESEPRCKIINSNVIEEDREKTTRYASCINLAIPRLTGDFVTYLTDDDIFYPRRFERMIKLFESDPSIHVVYGEQRIVLMENGKKIISGLRRNIGVTRSPVNNIDHNSIMHRRSCFEKVPYWSDSLDFITCADAAFFKELSKYWYFVPIPHITDEHRLTFDGMQSKKLTEVGGAVNIFGNQILQDRILLEKSFAFMDYKKENDLSLPKFKLSGKSKKILISGKLGDFIHAMYVAYHLWKTKGELSEVYITDKIEPFQFPLSPTFEELKPIIFQQEYVIDFKIWQGEGMHINTPLFRKSPLLGNAPWSEIMSYTFFNESPLTGAWMTYKEKKPQDSTIIINRSIANRPYITTMTQKICCTYVEELHKYQNRIFLGSKEDYELFPLKDWCELIIPNIIDDWFKHISSATMFFGNQSAPLAIASALNIPRIAELLCKEHMDWKHYWGEHVYSNIMFVQAN